MYLLRLFHRDDPAVPVAAHMLSEGTTRIGRDPQADWPIADPDCEISRVHLELSQAGKALSLKSLGANGAFHGTTGALLPMGEAVTVGLGEAIDFGRYRMVIDQAPFANGSGASFDSTMVFAAPFGGRSDAASDWAAATGAEVDDETPLLEAFCAGAGLDASALSGEEPAEIMRRAGEIYRAMVLGLGDLVSRRSSAKADLSLDRTTIAAEANNPFKWAPDRRLAIDLLRGLDAGFLPATEAIGASFEDVKHHMLGTLAGFEAALREVLAMSAPDAIEGRLDGRSSLLKSRAAQAWAEYAALHGRLQAEVAERRDGPINRAFVAGYAKGRGA